MAERTGCDTTAEASMPLWAKVQAVFVVLLILIVAGMSLGVIDTSLFGIGGGAHGPPGGAH